MVGSRVDFQEVPLQDINAVQRAVGTLVHALHLDDVTRHLSKPGNTEAFMRSLLQSYLCTPNQTLLAAPDFRCCALIAELHRQHEERSNDQGMAAEAAEADTYTRSDRAEALAQLKDQLQLESLVQEHGSAICIHFIASHPEWRGQGLGAKMMCHICQLADRGHKPLYLEATSARSQALYARHGFVHVADKPLDREGPVLRVMVRVSRAT